MGSSIQSVKISISSSLGYPSDELIAFDRHLLSSCSNTQFVEFDMPDYMRPVDMKMNTIKHIFVIPNSNDLIQCGFF